MARSRRHDVFISYASEDKSTAERVCAALEAAGIRCWIGPRDTQAGAYGRSIMEAIRSARMLVLILSPDADGSPNVLTEVAEAFDRKIPLLPFRLSNFPASDEMRFYVRTSHWIDAFPGPPEPHFASLIARVREHLGVPVALDLADATESEKSDTASGPKLRPKRRWVFGLTAVLGSLSIGLTLSFTYSRLLAPNDPPLDWSGIESGVVRVFTEFTVEPGQATTKVYPAVGTGFVVDDKFVVTTSHLVSVGQMLGSQVRGTARTFVRERGADRKLEAKIVWQSDSVGIAVLYAQELKAPPLTLWNGPSDREPRPGSRVVALTHAAGPSGETDDGALPPVVHTAGVVERTVSRSFLGTASLRVIQHSARLDRGASGGPLVSACGHVLGINAYSVPDTISGQRVLYALHVGLLTEALRTEPQLKGIRPVISDRPDCRG